MLTAGNGLIGFLIFVVIVVAINGFRFVFQKLNQSQQQQGRPQGDKKDWTAPQEQVRKFLQELTGQPVAEAAPQRQRRHKKRPEPEPAPEAKPEPQADSALASADAPSGGPTIAPEECPIYGYEIVCELGKGSMGVVYNARHIFTNRITALKILPLRLASKTQYLERFKR